MLERWTGTRIQTSIYGVAPIADKVSKTTMYFLGVWRQVPDALQLAVFR